MKYQKPEVEVIKFDKNCQFMTASGEEQTSGPAYDCEVVINNSNGTSYCAIVHGVDGGAWAGQVCYKLS